ncbi:MAG: DUF87 domain-containing protein [Candidatus Aenigmarchaeota archaeon]|nr:DUF87 domain-containing protein [Candidatus Aenigmarchaeota archaeon]
MMESMERLVVYEIKRLAPVLGRVNAARLSRAYLLADEDTKKRIFELLDAIKAAVYADPDLKDSVLREPPTPQESQGDIRIGNVLYGRKRLHPYSLPKASLLMHLGIFGSSGYGKTNLAYTLVDQVSRSGTPVIIFDFSKRNYRDLLAGPLRERIQLYTLGRNAAPLRFNPLLPPPGIQLSQWMKEFSSIFDHAYWLLGGGRNIILKALDNVYLENKRPRLQHLRSWLDEYGASSLPARERNWLATAERPLDSLCFKEIGEIFDVDEGVLPSEFFRPGQVTILELDALDVNDKTFFIEILLQWMRDWLLVNGKREQLQALIILEEAHHVLNREKSRKLGSETVMELIFREVRELGMGIVYIDQHPSLVSYPALGNTSTHVYMNLGLDTRQASDIDDAAKLLGIEDDEQPYVRRLPIGHGFFLARMRLHDTFLIEFPKYPLVKGTIQDEDVTAHMRRGLEGAPPPPLEKKELGEQELKVLQAIGDGRGAFASQIYTATKMSGKTFEKTVRVLTDLGLVGMHRGKSGKNVLHVFYLTEQGDARYGEQFPRKVQDSPKDAGEVIDQFREGGWELQGRKLVFEGGKMVVMIERSSRRDQLQEDLRVTPYFVCVTETIRAALLQEAARLATEGTPLTVYVASPEKFAKKREFEKVAF